MGWKLVLSMMCQTHAVDQEDKTMFIHRFYFQQERLWCSEFLVETIKGFNVLFFNYKKLLEKQIIPS